MNTVTFNFAIGSETPKGFFLKTEMIRRAGATPEICPTQGPFATEDLAIAAGDAFAAKAKAVVAWAARDEAKGITGTFSFQK